MHTLIIMTSNLGAEYLVNLGEDQDVNVVRDEVMNVVTASFRPEFLNRVDPRRLDRQGHRRFRPAEFPGETDRGRDRSRSLISG